MSDLPTIPIDPIVIPAVQSDTYDNLWVTEFAVNGDNPQSVTLYAILRPYSSTTGNILVQAGTEQVVSLQDLFGILSGTKIEPKLTPATIALGGQVMGGCLQFLKAVLADKAAPDGG